MATAPSVLFAAVFISNVTLYVNLYRPALVIVKASVASEKEYISALLLKDSPKLAVAVFVEGKSPSASPVKVAASQFANQYKLGLTTKPAPAPPLADIWPLELILPEAVMWLVTFKLPLTLISSPSFAPICKNILSSDFIWNPALSNMFPIVKSGSWSFMNSMIWLLFPKDSNLKRTVPLFLTSKSLIGPETTGESPNWPVAARTYPLALILPEAVMWPSVELI